MLQAHWLRLMQNLNFSTNEKTFQELVHAYSEKHRHYHNLSHIEATLKHLDTVKGLTEKPYEIELALWFHDSIYKPFSSTNELDSARWALRFLIENAAADAMTKRVYSLIMSTLHTSKAKCLDEKYMVDIDLTIFGSSRDIYQEFEKNVRSEYKLVPSFLYRKKRIEILSGFLNRDKIYQTDFFFEKFENQARLNLKNAVGILTSA